MEGFLTQSFQICLLTNVVSIFRVPYARPNRTPSQGYPSRTLSAPILLQALTTSRPKDYLAHISKPLSFTSTTTPQVASFHHPLLHSPSTNPFHPPTLSIHRLFPSTSDLPPCPHPSPPIHPTPPFLLYNHKHIKSPFNTLPAGQPSGSP